MTGETLHNLRGDYSRMRPDYTVEQAWDGYSEAEHALWRRLYARQVALAPRYACDEFVDTLEALHFGDGIPRFDAVNEKLGLDMDKGTGDWPQGLLSHAAGPLPTGWIVSEVWESKAAHEAWLAGRLGAALGDVGVPAPTRVTDSDLVAYRTP